MEELKEIELIKKVYKKKGRPNNEVQAFALSCLIEYKKQLSICDVSQQRELLSVFDGFYEWHKKQGYVSVKRDDFEEYLKTLNCA